MDPYPVSDLIRNLKADATDIVCKPVWIFLEYTVYSLTVFLIDLCTKIQGNPIFLQKHHCFSHVRFLRDLSCDLPGFLLADPFDFCQTLRFFLHDPQRI